MNVNDYFDDLVTFEGITTWLYCDSRGFVTTGIGNLVSSPSACAELPFDHRDGTIATNEEKASAWVRVNDAYNKSKSAVYYRAFSDLLLTEAFVRRLAEQRLESEFLPGIRRLCTGFDSFPLSARKALVDMAYNLGCAGLAAFFHMLTACNAGDWAKAAAQCHRVGCRESRNDWTSQMFIDAEASQPSS